MLYPKIKAKNRIKLVVQLTLKIYRSVHIRMFAVNLEVSNRNHKFQNQNRTDSEL